jgi:hypothetical protein
MRQAPRTPWTLFLVIVVMLIPMALWFYWAVAGFNYVSDNTLRFSTKSPHSRSR